MCLAVPMKIVSIDGAHAVVEVDGLRRTVGLVLLPEIHSEYGHGLHEEVAAEGYAIYDFFFPGLVIDALETGRNGHLVEWIREVVDQGYVTVNMLGCHDGIPVLDLNAAGELEVYVDGADESNRYLQLIKGGGGALTREKIIAAASRKFVCIADKSKLVDYLGRFPLPVEVIPMARSYVARELVKLGGDPVYREGVVTDNGNVILDVHDMSIVDPRKLEKQLNDITGVVTNGLFALKPADVLLLGTQDGVRKLER